MATNDTTQASDARIPKDLEERRQRQRQAIIAAQTPSERERETERTAENLLSSEKLGIAKVQDQPIAMPFIRGQSAGIQRQTAAKLEPLQTRLARLQAERTQQGNLAQSRLGFVEEDISEERAVQQATQQSLADRQKAIRKIAQDAQERGADANAIQSILASESVDQAMEESARLSPEPQSEYEIRSIGGGGLIEVETDPQTGAVLNTRIVRESSSGDDTPTPEEQGITDTLVRETATELNATRGDDGFVNTADYAEVYNEWLRLGGTPDEFKKQFPPEAYVNPSDPTVPGILRPDGENDNPFG